MAAIIPQGTVNKLRGSISFPDFPAINITNSFLGSEGIKITYSGETTTIIPTMTGIVTSPEPYMMVEIAAHIMRTNGMSGAITNQLKASSTVGNAVVRSDVSTESDVTVLNASITGLGEVHMDGKNPAQMITFKGYWPINSNLFGG
jgi:hypothetical protein